MTLLFAADTGGTFTDFVGIDGAGGLCLAKCLTDYGDSMRGVLAAVGSTGATFADASSFRFGTTLVINTYLQRNGARTALVTTRGFRDTLEIGRGNRPHPFDLGFRRDPPLISRENRFTIGERMAADGTAVAIPDAAGLADLIEVLRAGNYEAVAVSFINAYANDAHERQLAEALKEGLPGVFITRGTQISREWYEYERTSTASANAYVGPLLGRFITSMTNSLEQESFRGTAYIMSSSGGIVSLDEATEQPVQLVESGPVGGCIGAAAYASGLGIAQLIAYDMDGTTAKCALIGDGRFETRSPYYVGGAAFGFPIRSSVIDIVEVGAGGGSVAHLDDFANLRVGPRSAASSPGPACYGRGGTEPTMTDANLVLDRIGGGSFLNGDFQLDRGAAEAAILAKVGRPLGYGDTDVDRVAQGILDLGALAMGDAVRRITTERELDPREFTLFTFGGGGPVHASALARDLGIPRLVVPPYPGLFSCIGMLLAEAVADETRTFLRPLNASIVAELAAVFESLERSTSLRLPSGDGPPKIDRFAELRYKGQRHTMKMGLADLADPPSLAQAFHDAYQRRYGHADRNAPIETRRSNSCRSASF
jgi:N-methylhydantoinase A